MKFSIKKIEKCDLDTIETIGYLSLPIWYKESDLYFLLFDKSYILNKICQGEKIVGFIVVKIYDKRFHIMSIAILKEHRNKGLGTLLVNKIKNLNCEIISLYVLTTNIGAIKFYETNGFKNIKKNNNYYESLETKSAFYYEYSC